MLDHGKSIEQCRRAIALGFTDVMYDGSALPLEQNIANTRALVREAHAAGVGVEAELGQVGSGKDYQSFGGQRRGFTDPAQVERFVTESGVDMLAVAFGTAHGAYHGTPRLDLELLAEIRRRTDVPLVMHGGTGLTPEQFRAAIAAGIVKINVATDLVHSAGAAIRTAAGAQDATFFSVVKALRAALAERCTHYIDLFGAAGKGV
jgi:fructose-bisphosphate aldolase class II